MSDPGLPVAGWYADPTGVDQLRWWGGLAWTEHVKPKPVPAPTLAASAPVAVESRAPTAVPYVPLGSTYVPFAASAPSMQPQASSYPTSSNTIPIWLIAALPIPVAVVRAIGIVSGANYSTLWIVVVALSLVAVSAALAFWDNLVLTRRGLPAPSVLWVLLSVIAYVIARRSKMKKVGVSAFASGRILGVAIAISVGLLTIVSYANQSTSSLRFVDAMEETIEQQLAEADFPGWSVDCDKTVGFRVGVDLPCVATKPQEEAQEFSLQLHSDGTVTVVDADGNPLSP